MTSVNFGREICTAFHFAASQHLFDNTMSELSYKLKPQTGLQGNTSAPSFNMSSFCLREVIDARLITDNSNLTGADNLDAFCS